MPVLLLFAAGSLAVTGTLAYAQATADREILSSDEGALLPPEHWECSLYVEEYEDFLEAGNQPETWRFANKRYRSAGDGERYDWREWLEWYEKADCVAGAVPRNANFEGARGARGGGMFADDMTAIGIVAGLVVTGLIAAGGGGSGGGGSGGGSGGDSGGSGGGNNKSPG